MDIRPVSETAIFAWLATWTIISRSVLTLFNVPHLALGGELSKDQHERSQLFSANTIFGMVSGPGFIFIAYTFFLLMRLCEHPMAPWCRATWLASPTDRSFSPPAPS